MKPCPYCAEEIQDAAILCKHCGKELSDEQPPIEIEPAPRVLGLASGVRRRIGFAVVVVGLMATWAFAEPPDGPGASLYVIWFGSVLTGLVVLSTGWLVLRVPLALFLSVVLVYLLSPDLINPATSQQAGPSARTAPPRENRPAELNLSAGDRQMAIIGISNNPEVRDATIGQDGSELNLVLVVSAGTSQSRAQELGENFVRMVKTYAGDGDAPGREIGRGSFDYLVGVYTPDETRIALGAKVSFSPRVTW